MIRDSDALQAELHARAFWHEDAGGTRAEHAAWYIRILLGAAAWLAACLFLPLIGVLLADVIDMTPWSGFMAAVVCCALAVPLLRSHRGDFFVQLGSALSLAGLALAFSQTFTYDGRPGGWFSLGVLACVMYGAAPVSAHRFLCGLVISAALVIAIHDPLGHGFAGGLETSGGSVVALAAIALLIWGAQLSGPAHPRWQALVPLAWAFSLAASILAWVVSADWFQDGEQSLAALQQIAPAGLCAIAPSVVWWYATRRAAGALDGRTWPVQRAAAGLLLLLLVPVWLAVPGAALALCWVLMGFALFRVALVGFGVTALLAHLAAHYYQTHTSLLQKSFWLFVAGIVLVCVAMLAGMWQRRGK